MIFLIIRLFDLLIIPAQPALWPTDFKDPHRALRRAMSEPISMHTFLEHELPSANYPSIILAQSGGETTALKVLR